MELLVDWLESASFQLFFMKFAPNRDAIQMRAIPSSRLSGLIRIRFRIPIGFPDSVFPLKTWNFLEGESKKTIVLEKFPPGLRQKLSVIY
jgi:hypothetical protein